MPRAAACGGESHTSSASLETPRGNAARLAGPSAPSPLPGGPGRGTQLGPRCSSAEPTPRASSSFFLFCGVFDSPFCAPADGAPAEPEPRDVPSFATTWSASANGASRVPPPREQDLERDRRVRAPVVSSSPLLPGRTPWAPLFHCAEDGGGTAHPMGAHIGFNWAMLFAASGCAGPPRAPMWPDDAQLTPRDSTTAGTPQERDSACSGERNSSSSSPSPLPGGPSRETQLAPRVSIAVPWSRPARPAATAWTFSPSSLESAQS